MITTIGSFSSSSFALSDSEEERELLEEFREQLESVPAENKGNFVKKFLEGIKEEPHYPNAIYTLFDAEPDLSQYLDESFALKITSIQWILEYLTQKGSLPQNIDLSIASTRPYPGSEEELTEAILTWASNPTSNEDKYIIHKNYPHFSLFYLHKNDKQEISLFHLDSLGCFPTQEGRRPPQTNFNILGQPLQKLKEAGKTVTHYVFSAKRQRSPNSCAVFTIRDLVATARNPIALRKDAIDSVHSVIEEGPLKALYFDKLPGDLVKSSDSLKSLREYRQKYGNSKVHTKKRKAGRTALSRFLELHKKTHPKSGRIQNGYISSRQMKYGHIVIKKFFDSRSDVDERN